MKAYAHTGWAKSRYTVINYILYTYFWPTLYMIIFSSVRLRMINVSDRICIQNQNTHCIFNNFFFVENRAVYKIL